MQGLEDFVRSRVLQHVAGGAGAQHRQHILAIIQGGDSQHTHLGPTRSNDFCGLDATHLRHLNVHHHDIRQQAFNGRDGFSPVLRLAYHLDLRVA
ncbi:hypothetical protein SDC9_142219 [bioreactor metagenome]|uniref:Uncharacterized protein n=1 Tax=bioreactor metagenome TaxID=1076179 RepID=A0A645E121_9ZZZZ